MIEQSEQLLKNVITGANLGFWDWYYKTGDHIVDDRWLDMIGIQRSEILNKDIDWKERIHPDDRLNVEQEIQNAINNDVSYRAEFRMKHNDGSWVWIEGSGKVLERDLKTNQPIRLCGTHQDRTIEKQLQSEKIDNYSKTVDSLVALIEHRDSYTGGHSQRVAMYSKMVAEEMDYSLEDCKTIYQAGILHDIGKVTTPDTILLKPGKLNNDEYKLIQSHAQTGADMLKKIPMYQKLSDIVLSHHERIDGSGYPQGLKKEKIPPLAKIMGVCDAFDAMTTNRIYKGRKSVKEALTELQSLAGVHYEEKVVMAAHKVLSTLELNDDTSQLPETKLEQQRFAFFFKDQITEAFNENYLKIILQRNQFDFQYICLCVVFLKNFSQYNVRFGWKQGDKVLKHVSQMLQKHVPGGLIFRLHGDDFIILNTEHNEIELSKFEHLSNLSEKNISLQHIHFHIQKDEINSVDDLETKIQQSLSSYDS
jgi:putative nucleotidyltransferase with HDIG domain/diguanylate cyclase (GGDEF)-like protein/PAS domain S-box-containing protein